MATAHDQLLIDTIAHHFPEARVDGNVVWLGVGTLSVVCAVDETGDIGDVRSAALSLSIRGDEIGAPVFAPISGYGASDQEAVVDGARAWSHAFGPVLRAALGEPLPEVASFDAVVDGRPAMVFVGAVDRAFVDSRDDDTAARIAAARQRFGGPRWMAERVLAASGLPVLGDGPLVLGLFALDGPVDRAVEVLVNGRDWPAARAAFDGIAPEPVGGLTLLRELAIAVPRRARLPLTRAAVKRTLAALPYPDAPASDPTGWRGWQRHRGAIGAPLLPDELAALETEIGGLPDDYRQFLLEIGRAGAGPGYGLLRPTGAGQRKLARGTFTGAGAISGGPSGALMLAHAGCGVAWLLVLDGDHAGEVWLDASACDRSVRRVAPSFSAWYTAWLEASFRQARPWTPWETRSCPSVSVFSQVIDANRRSGDDEEAAIARLASQIKPGALRVTCDAAAYFERGASVDPCHSCLALAARLGVADEAFAHGDDPLPGRADTPEAGIGGFFRKLFKTDAA